VDARENPGCWIQWRLFVNGAEQRTLIVNDLKQLIVNGAIALWVGPGTIAHFSDLKVTP